MLHFRIYYFQSMMSGLKMGSFFLLIMMLMSCYPDKQIIYRSVVPENTLRLDGYYYYQQEGGEYLFVYFLYEDGITKYQGGAGGPNKISFEQYEKTELGDSIDIKYRNGDNWGVFNIEGKKITHQFRVPGVNQESLVDIGEILNDSTFKMTKRYEVEFGRMKYLKEISKEYHFRAFDRKPDVSQITHLR